MHHQADEPRLVIPAGVFALSSRAVALADHGWSIMNVKDWLPAAIQSSGIERKLSAGQMLCGQG